MNEEENMIMRWMAALHAPFALVGGLLQVAGMTVIPPGPWREFAAGTALLLLGGGVIGGRVWQSPQKEAPQPEVKP